MNRSITKLIGIFCCASGLFFAVGCEDDDDDTHIGGPIQDGQGALIIDNQTDNHIAVFLDGTSLERAREDEEQRYDLEPGQYRLVLDEEGGDAVFSSDIDILAGRFTDIDVYKGGFGSDRFEISVDFD